MTFDVDIDVDGFGFPPSAPKTQAVNEQGSADEPPHYNTT